VPVLVIQTAFLGDVVLTTPLFEALARRAGPVDVLTTPAALPLVETHPAVRRAIPYDKRGKDRGVARFLALARTLRAERYEAAYLPHRSLRTAALAWLARIPRRIGFHDGWPLLYTEARHRPARGHESDRLLALAGEPPGVFAPRVATTSDDRAVVDTWLHAAGFGDGFVALAPGSIWGSKRWPYYAELAVHLASRGGIVVVGGPEDVDLADEITEAVRRSGGPAVNACGQLTLRQSAALIGRARLLVTNDSAPLHLATAMGTPVVAVFGPTIPEFGFGPIREGDASVGLTGLGCRPCSDHGPRACPLGHHRCMRELSVDRVLAVIEETGALRRRD
jgi:lipopolysaccharide heptosyltransferase II